MVTAIGLGLTPFTGGASLGLTLIGGALLVGGINNAINHVSITTTGNELNLAGMAGKWWDVNVAQPVAALGGGWEYVGGFLSGAGHALTGMAQLNVYQIGVSVTVLATDQAARDALWAQVTGFVGKVVGGDKFAAGQAVGEAASLFIPGAAVVKAGRAAGLITKAGELGGGLVKPVKILTPAVGTIDKVQGLKNALADATRAKGLPGYDPTGGLGWERFLDEYLKGFDVEGRPVWKWPDDPPHTNGFVNGVSKPADLVPGDTLERITFRNEYGEPRDGNFAAPPGTTFDQLSLPPDRLGGNTTVVRYEILKPLPESVRVGEIARGFEQPGLGTQYHFPDGIRKLIDQGYLKEI